MDHARATEPMYSLYGTVRATAIGSHYGFVGKRIIEKKHFIYCTQKKKIDKRVSLCTRERFESGEDIVEVGGNFRFSWSGTSPSTGMSVLPLSVSLNRVPQKARRSFFGCHMTFYELRI